VNRVYLRLWYIDLVKNTTKVNRDQRTDTITQCRKTKGGAAGNGQYLQELHKDRRTIRVALREMRYAHNCNSSATMSVSMNIMHLRQWASIYLRQILYKTISTPAECSFVHNRDRNSNIPSTTANFRKIVGESDQDENCWRLQWIQKEAKSSPSASIFAR
jgi:hypothetical protein